MLEKENALLRLRLPRTLRSPVPIATDASLLHAAVSYVQGYGDTTDPRAARAFSLLSDAYCNGADLVLPLPASKQETIPLFLPLWRSRNAVTVHPNLELSDEGYDAIADMSVASFTTFVEASPSAVTELIRFQFSPPIAGESGLYDIEGSVRRAAAIAHRCFEGKQLPNLSASIVEAERRYGFQEPTALAHLVGTPDLPSFLHLCVAYAFSIYVRGYSYALGLSSGDVVPVYRHHWLRAPMLRTVMPSEVATRLADEPTEWFPWGDLITSLLAPGGPAVRRDIQSVSDLLDGIRSQGGAVRDALSAGLFDPPEATSLDSHSLTQAEGFLVEILRVAGAPLRYHKEMLAERARSWLTSIVHEKSPLWQVPVELVTANLQPRWVRDRETVLRTRFRRDTYWDVFDRSEISRAIQTAQRRRRKPQ
jgi:hypothetical protein